MTNNTDRASDTADVAAMAETWLSTNKTVIAPANIMITINAITQIMIFHQRCLMVSAVWKV